MKNFSLKPAVAVILFVLMGILSGCKNEEGVGDFAVSVKSTGFDNAEFIVTAPNEVQVAWMLSSTSRIWEPSVLFREAKDAGNVATIAPGGSFRVDKNITASKKYYLSVVAALDAATFTDVKTIQFTSQAYSFDEFMTVVETTYDGYTIHVNVSDETIGRGNALRYSMCSLPVYNKVHRLYGYEDTDNLLQNGGAHTRFFKNDTTFIINDANIYEVDDSGNVLDDGNGNAIDFHDPVVPGEPCIFMAGEFTMGNVNDMGFSFGLGDEYDTGYFIPCYDWDKSEWTGAFEKKQFLAKEPSPLDAEVKIEIPEDEIGCIDAMIYITPDEGVYQYIYAICDVATYNAMLELLDDERYMQWFLTSYIAMYELGVEVTSGNQVLNAASMFVEPLAKESTYYVLLTAMGDEEGTTQRFYKKEFTTKRATKPRPEIVVTPHEPNYNYPYLAGFNVKAPNKDFVAGYYAAEHPRQFHAYIKQNYDYPTLLQMSNTFSTAEIEKINSDEGYDIWFNTLDGEVTRLAVYGCNDEYTFNVCDPSDPSCTAIADYTAPYAAAKPTVNSPLFEELVGSWTATAEIQVTSTDQDGYSFTFAKKHSSTVEITSTAPAVPDNLPVGVDTLYKDKTKEEVMDMLEALKEASGEFTDNRLVNQNRLLATGFLDFDYYEPSRLETRTPWGLFCATDYASIDIAQLIYDFGPKWFLEVRPDGSVYVPFAADYEFPSSDMNYLPPMSNWTGSPYYICAYSKETNNGHIYPQDGFDGFPVEISEDRNTITIKPILYGGDTFYMNAMYVDASSGALINAPVLSELVLRRKGSTSKKAAVLMSESETEGCMPVIADVRLIDSEGRDMEAPKPLTVKSLTKFNQAAAPKKDYNYVENPTVITKDAFDAAINRQVEKIFNIKVNE